MATGDLSYIKLPNADELTIKDPNAVTSVKDADNTTYTKSSGVVSVPSASTSARGVTKLSSATNSTSEVLAATPKAVKTAYDLANTAKSAANSKYSLPSGGIPKSDLASGVQTSIGLADTSVQSVGGDSGAISASGTTSVTVSHSTGAGYKHIPTNGAAGNILAYGDSSGTAKWASLATGLGQGYGTCGTEEATVDKVATLSGYDLIVGGIVAIKFTNKVPASATLSINGKTAKSIYYKGSAIVAGVITAGMTASFLYDGNYYHLIAKDIDNNTTYTNAGLGQGYGTCTTAASTAAKEVTLGSYALTTGGIVSVNFKYDVPASATMNINSKGAKAIYYRGAAITAGIIKAGDTATFIYNGTYYHLISIDRDDNTSAVTGVKGNAESSFRTGDVNITAANIGLGNVGNFKAVSTVASQGLSDTEKSNARANIGAGTGNGTYSKPSGGIPKSDLASDVQTSLGKADSALQSHQTIKQDGVTGATVNRFGTCSTAAATAAKTVSITSGTFNLEAGARVTVKFSNANTASTPTLNVNSKGAKNIYSKGSQITTGSNKSLLAGTVDFIYDGTQWHLIGNYIDTNTTYSNGTGITIGSGNVINHSNSITASGTTAAALKVKYDAQGHITGSAALSASDIGLGSTGAAVTGVSTTATSTATGYIGISSYNSTTKTLTLKGILAPTASTFVKTS